LALARARCEFISDLTGIAAEPIWQWGFMERMSTGLYLMQLGWRDEGLGMLKVADALAA
jgi:streptomycin 6-kinase